MKRVIGGRTGPGQGAHVVDRQALATALADAVLVDRASAAAVLDERGGASVGRGVPVAPAHQRVDGRPQVEPLRGEAVLVARRVLLVGGGVRVRPAPAGA